MSGYPYTPTVALQDAAFEFIVERWKTQGYPPTIREIAEAIGARSSGTAQAVVVALESSGRIHRTSDRRRIICDPRGDER